MIHIIADTVVFFIVMEWMFGSDTTSNQQVVMNQCWFLNLSIIASKINCN